MRTPGKPWRAGQPDGAARQTRKRAGFYRDESGHKLRRTKRGRAAERPRRGGGWGRVKKESRLKKDECADKLWVLLLRGTEYHCEEWEHMGIAVRCQQAYWHHTETQAVIKSYLIYSHSVLLSFSAAQCLLSSLTHSLHFSHTHTACVRLYSFAVYEVRSMFCCQALTSDTWNIMCAASMTIFFISINWNKKKRDPTAAVYTTYKKPSFFFACEHFS